MGTRRFHPKHIPHQGITMLGCTQSRQGEQGGLRVGSASAGWKLHYVAAGTMQWQIGAQTITAPPRSWLLMPPHTQHGGSGDNRTAGTFYWLHLTESARGWPHAKHILQTLRKRNPNQPCTISPYDVTPLWESLLNCAGISHDQQQKVLFEHAWLGLFLAFQAAQHVPETLSPCIREACRYLRKHIDEMPAIAMLAEQAGLKPSRFRQRFQAETGMSPRDYRLQLQMEQAQILLKRQRLSILDIALRVGFSGQQSFATAFRRHHDCTPSQWQAAQLPQST